MSNSDSVKPNIAMRMVVDGKEHLISFEELTLSNNLGQEALVSLLIRKKIIDGQELLDEISRIRQDRYKTEPGQE
jgi:hypothetical protein